MGQTAQITPSGDEIKPILEKEDQNSNIGTFRPTEKKVAPGQGPMFTTQNINPSNQPKVGLSEIKLQQETNLDKLENFDIRRLASILAQESIKIGNIDNEHVTENDKKKVLQALYILNPKKYPFVVEKEEKITPKDITPITPKPKNTTTPEIPKPTTNIEQPTKIKSPILRVVKLGTPKKASLLARQEVHEELAQVEGEKAEVAASKDLFEELHPKEAVALTTEPETASAPIQKIENTQQQTEATPEKGVRLAKVEKLVRILDARFTTTEEWAGPTAHSVLSKKSPLDNTLNPNLPIKNNESWKDNIPNEKLQSFLKDISTLSEELLISKYIPSYANPGNPSSWSTVSEFDAFEIMHSGERIYGLTDDQRLQTCELITQMEELTKIAKANLNISSGVTIHSLYEQTRKLIASANKIESN